MKNDLKEFNAAKNLSFSLPRGTKQQAKVNGVPVNYWGCKDREGQCWVIADSTEYMQYPDAVTDRGEPMRKVEEFCENF